MTIRNTKTKRHAPSKASTGCRRKRYPLIGLVLLTVVVQFSQMYFHTFVDDSKQLSESRHLQESLRPLPMNFSKGSKYEAVRGDGTRAVAQRKERSSAAVNSTLTGKRQFAQYAYAFVVGGCNPDEEFPPYRYFVYNILVSTRVLREAGSQADIVAFFQISYQSTYDRLLSEDVRLLEAMNIRIEYIPKSPYENFYRTGEYMSCGYDR
jgi:hypothetical protein